MENIPHPNSDNTHTSRHKGFGNQSSKKTKLSNRQQFPKVDQLFAKAVNYHQQQQFDRALTAYQQILAIDPKYIDALTNLGSLLKHLGQVEEAIAIYHQGLALKPESAETWFNLGNALHDIGQLEAAESAFEQTVQLKPNLGVAHFKLAKVLQEQEKLTQAADCYRQAITLMPDSAQAYTNLGNVLKALGELEAAIAYHHQALQLQPNSAQTYYNLGNALTAQEQYESAITTYQQALQLKPDWAEALLNLAVACLALENLEEAEQALKQALVLKSDFSTAHFHLGRLLQKQGDSAAAEVHLRQCWQLQPDEPKTWEALLLALQTQGKYSEAIALLEDCLKHHPDRAIAYYYLGSLYNNLRQFPEAISHLQQALQLDPNLAIAHNNLGYALIQGGQLSGGIESCLRAIEIQPDLAIAYLNQGLALNNQGRVPEAIACFQETLLINPDYHPGNSNLLYALNYSPAHSPATVAAAHHQWGQQVAKVFHQKSLSKVQNRSVERSPARSVPQESPKSQILRVGYVSPDFRQHSVTYFFEPILSHHDPTQVEIFCYANVPNPDAVTERLRSLCPNWRDVYNLDDDQLADLVRLDGIDILVDLAGHTGSNRLPMFIRQPAPIQVTYLGYPNTTGLVNMDYRLTDSWADPPGLTDEYYTEKVIRLPRCFLCYQPSPTAPPVMDVPAKRMGRITFGSFNNLPKITPEVIALWSQILHSVPNSRIILKIRWFDDRPTRDRYLSLFADYGIDSQRVKLVGVIPDPNHHLAFYGNIDIALDPFPYNGTTTTCEALWMGVPVITLAGQTHVSRVGVSLLTTVGLPDLIASTPGEYVTKAVALASDLSMLSQLRANLRQQVAASHLCNAVDHTQRIEAIYRQLWQQSV
ncbi:tetratricopeptide repeat protein [Nostoc sp. KVJ3]|uniref:tetratricopeptide repeat protein n=1 Tax=Nostoc sp. KVJ3 TaxID=457945 RepID=UPI0022386842|nr:tetratricopeptide repeat protein [Nostoc sp. KVJ3]MCW5314225.1 tetratricopeptide repeat protein [Nostoc sp. KVJ3]